ncbi:MAG: hypothetical protein QOG53_3575 [Frankiales bacterium]|nr:hypothetical protein [Frankiales bacterium]
MIDDIVTDRLILRALTADEARAVVDGPRQSAWSDEYPTDGDREIAAFLLQATPYEPEPLGVRQLVARESGLVVGGIGFYGGPDPDGQITMGFGVAEEFRRRGLTTEAAIAMIELASCDGRVSCIVADTTVDNVASRRVLEKSGFTVDRTEGAQVFYRLDLRGRSAGVMAAGSE